MNCANHPDRRASATFAENGIAKVLCAECATELSANLLPATYGDWSPGSNVIFIDDRVYAVVSATEDVDTERWILTVMDKDGKSQACMLERP